MAKRLALINSRISQQNSFINDPVTYFGFDQLLLPTQNQIRLKVRSFVDKQIKGKFIQNLQNATFPHQLIPKLRQLDIIQHFFSQPFGKKFPTHALGFILAELSRGDANISTFMWLESCLIGFTVQMFGSESQKNDILPKLRNLEMIGGWALTQENVGSDAGKIESTITKSNNGMHYLNGNKRWIGNGNSDILIVWAKNLQNNHFEGYLVLNASKGVHSSPIKNKLSLRMVQNCQIYFTNVQIVMQQQKLPKASRFSDINKVLKHSRLFVCWIAIGLGMGVYEAVIQYGSKCIQFGKPILGFQIVQEKVVKIMACLQACICYTYHVSKLVDKDSATMGQVSMSKAYVTAQVRQICKWGRQILGGNGITLEKNVMKALVDIEGIYTYQGTYDINILIAARQITGLSSINKSS